MLPAYTVMKHSPPYSSDARASRLRLTRDSDMPRSKERTDQQSIIDTPRPWLSGDEFAERARLFTDAARHFIGRGEDSALWSPSQVLRMKLAHIIECADNSEDSQRILHQMLKVAEGQPGFEYRRLAVQAIQAWGGFWKLPQWQVSTESRKACLSHLVAALEAFDEVFSRLRHDLDSLAVKLDAYAPQPENPAQKSAERILAELVVEGTDALGFAVEPREPMQAEVLRIERQLEYTSSPVSSAAPPRDSRTLRKALVCRSSPRNDPPVARDSVAEQPPSASDPSRRGRAR